MHRPSDAPDASTYEQRLIRLAEELAFTSSARKESAPPAEPTTPTPSSHEPFIPGYEIVRNIHRGSQGVVYQALHETSRRVVAIKVMRLDAFTTPRDVVRFEREVEILRQLDHPRIVRIHDSGVADGRYYFVMDYIEGDPLDAFIARSNPTVRSTVQMFAKICDAVNAAHVRGVIHRDLKPGNIKVDANGEPYVLDFGLAKLATQEGTDHAVTTTGQFIGSLPWASPEQVSGVPGRIDLRSDVYSLGVILYQILTGRFPYEVAGNTRDVLDNILRAEPSPPRPLRRDIDADIETIVLQCLCKEPERRYQNAGDLTRDIQHYLHGRPIEAKRDRISYVFQKFIARHRVAAVIACLFAATTAAFGATWMTMRRRTAAAEEKATQIQLEFLDRTLSTMQPGNAAPHDQQLLADLDAASERIRTELAGFPQEQADLWEKLGTLCRRLSLFDRAAQNLHASLKIRRELWTEADPEVAAGMHSVAALYWDIGRFDEAIALYSEVLKIRREKYGDVHAEVADTLNHLAACFVSKGENAAAQKYYEEVLQIRRQLLGDDNPDVAAAMYNLAGSYMETGRHHEALALFEKSHASLLRLEQDGRLVGDERPQFLAKSYTGLGACLVELGETARARPLLDGSLEIKKRDLQLSDNHVSIAQTIHWQARLHQMEGDLTTAEELCKKALHIRVSALPPDHVHIAISRTLLGSILLDANRANEAEPLLIEALATLRAKLPETHWRIAYADAILGQCYLQLGRSDEGEALLHGSFESLLAAKGPDDPATAEAAETLIDLYEKSGRSHESNAVRQAIVNFKNE